VFELRGVSALRSKPILKRRLPTVNANWRISAFVRVAWRIATGAAIAAAANRDAAKRNFIIALESRGLYVG
jgi:hypothetical protein